MILDEGPYSSRLIGEIRWIAGRAEKVIDRFGVEAARAAGMRSFAYVGGVAPASRLEGPGAVVFLDIRELPELLGEG